MRIIFDLIRLAPNALIRRTYLSVLPDCILVILLLGQFPRAMEFASNAAIGETSRIIAVIVAVFLAGQVTMIIGGLVAIIPVVLGTHISSKLPRAPNSLVGADAVWRALAAHYLGKDVMPWSSSSLSMDDFKKQFNKQLQSSLALVVGPESTTQADNAEPASIEAESSDGAKRLASALAEPLIFTAQEIANDQAWARLFRILEVHLNEGKWEPAVELCSATIAASGLVLCINWTQFHSGWLSLIGWLVLACGVSLAIFIGLANTYLSAQTPEEKQAVDLLSAMRRIGDLPANQ